jgi:tetraacyldisaccharide 4'-kinase
LNQESYRKLISGESGCRCPFVGLGLSFAAMIYSLVIRLRNFLYDKGWLKTHRVNATVLSIGNITVGGTGKTPLVIWLYNHINQKSKIKNQNCGCAILTRGYKTHLAKRKNWIPAPRLRGDKLAPAKAGAGMTGRDTQYALRNTETDEPAILAESCPEAKVIINPDRVAGANEAINKFGAKILIMDDGFQHRRLHRDIDIVTIDATCPFGYGRILPAGLLREPITSLKRADAVVITRCDQINETKLRELEEKLQEAKADIIIARSIHKPVRAKLADGKEISIEQLKGIKVFAFCGIGNPQAFLDTIKDIGAETVGSKIYNDHYHYTEKDISDIYEQAKQLGVNLILTTQKDLSRLSIENRKSKIDIPLAYLVIELKFISGEDKIRNLIVEVLSGRICKK